MKRIISLLLVLIFLLAGCGGDPAANSPDPGITNTQEPGTFPPTATDTAPVEPPADTDPQPTDSEPEVTDTQPEPSESDPEPTDSQPQNSSGGNQSSGGQPSGGNQSSGGGQNSGGNQSSGGNPPAGQAAKPYYIKVNRVTNTVTVYTLDEDNRYTVPVKSMICSVGMYNNTPRGVFRIYGTRWEWLGLFGGVYGHYVTQISGHYLFHSVPYLVWGDKSSLKPGEFDRLGEPASRGCIRLQAADALWIYGNANHIWAVEIFDGTAEDDPLGRPEAPKIAGSEFEGWDPSDPDPNNPWYTLTPDPDPGETDTDPGETDTDPGETDTDPGETDTDPGETDTDPGETDTDPGETDTDPGETDTDPGETDTNPGETDTDPGETDTDPGETDTDPEPTESDPGPVDSDPAPSESDPTPSDSDPASGESDPPPAESDPVPGESDPAPAESDPPPAESDPAPEEGEPAPEETGAIL